MRYYGRTVNPTLKFPRGLQVLAAERRVRIVELLQHRSSVDTGSLCGLFSTTRETIRTDLKLLEIEGLLRRTRGGAVANAVAPVSENPFLFRSGQQQEAKRTIGRAASALIRSGDSVALDGSTTSLWVAKSIPSDLPVTVLTNSVPIIQELLGKAAKIVVCSGGTLRPRSLVFVGKMAERAFRDYHVDKLFVGTRGVTLEPGLTDSYEPEVDVKRAMLESAGEVVLVADASKFGYVGFIKVAPLSAVHTIITDSSIPPETVESYRSLGINLLIACQCGTDDARDGRALIPHSDGHGEGL